jgi:hypothetical protein
MAKFVSLIENDNSDKGSKKRESKHALKKKRQEDKQQ